MKYLKTYNQIINEISNNEISNLDSYDKTFENEKDTKFIKKCKQLINKYGKPLVHGHEGDKELIIKIKGDEISNNIEKTFYFSIKPTNYYNIELRKVKHEGYHHYDIILTVPDDTTFTEFEFYNKFSKKIQKSIKKIILDPDLIIRLEANKMGLL